VGSPRASTLIICSMPLSRSRGARIIEGVGARWLQRVALHPKLASTAPAHARTAAAGTSTSSARVA
jgi:hypothetical protein